MPDVTAPVIENESPLNGAVNVLVSAPLNFDIVDVLEPGASGQVDITSGDYFLVEDISGLANGVTTVFTMPTEVHTSNIEVYRDGALQNFSITITVTDPEAGEITITPAPDAGAVWLVRYLQGFVLNAVDFPTITLSIDASPVFQNGVWAPGWDGILEPVLRGYRFSVTTHPIWTPSAVTNVSVEASDRLGNNNTINWSFNAAAAVSVPYVTTEVPANGSFNASVSTDIDFDIITDSTTATTVTLNTVNVWLNGQHLVVDGVVPPSVAAAYTINITPITKGQHVSINPLQNLGVQVHRIDANGVDDSTPTPAYGEDYFEFSTDSISYVLQLNAKIPLDCPYDLLPDPYLVTASDASYDKYAGSFTSPTAYWGTRGTVETDTLRVGTGVTSGDFIVRAPGFQTVSTYGRPRSSTVFSGTVSLTNGSPTVVGTGTLFNSEIAAGYTVQFGTSTTQYQVLSVSSNSSLTLSQPYSGVTTVTPVAIKNSALVSTSGFKRRRYSSSNPVRTTANSPITYPLMKVWGNTNTRYWVGYPSAAGYPVPFTVPTYAVVYNRSDGANAGMFDAESIHPPAALNIPKQKYLKFSVSSNNVAGANFDRYALDVSPVVNPVQVGGRAIVQFSFTSMDVNAELYFGLGNNYAQPSLDGNHRSGFMLRRVVSGASDKIHMAVYQGTASTPLATTGIDYSYFINKLWVAETEVVAVGSATTKLYEFEKDLHTPAVTKTVIGGTATTANNFSIVSFGNGSTDSGAKVVGAVHYVDVELNPSMGGPYLPFALAGDVTLPDTKWRPYANTFPTALTVTAGLNSIQSKCSMFPLGTESDTVTDYHVLDTEPTYATIDSLKPETLVEVLAIEDPTISGTTNPNANVYRRASLRYETADESAGIVFVSKVGGPTGNLKSIEIIQTAASTPFGIVVTGDHMAITLATDISGNVTTTIQNIVDAIDAVQSYTLDAIPSGDTGHVVERMGSSNLYGGSAYKVSDSPRFNELALSFRANKTGTYYLSVSDSTVFGMAGGAVLQADGTFTTATPIFQPTDVGKVINITNANTPTNVGSYTIVAVINGSSYQYPTNIVMLNRSDFTAESNTLTWFLETRGYLISSGSYTRINSSKKIAILTQDFGNLSDGAKNFNVLVCKNMLITSGVVFDGDSVLSV